MASWFGPLHPNFVRDAVLGQWGITVLSSDERHPEKALATFLEQLARDVDEAAARAAS